MAKILSINISEKKGIPKERFQTAILVEDYGIENDAHAGKWHRQVSLLANESIEKMRELGAENLEFGVFAENITTEGIELHKLPIGTKLKIGEALLEVTQIGKECHSHCGVYEKVGMCIMPIQGIFAKVIKGGSIDVGDEIKVENK